ncbi:response regulator transcription factor [Dorea longicatena]|nr:AraC family transcriptional regulator [Dorea longicatena]
MGFEIVGSYRTPQKALPAIISKKPDLVITDIRMPGMTGMELIKSVRSQKINCEFIIVSGHSDFSYAQEAISYGVAGYCLKPLDPHETSEALNRAKNHLDSRKTITPEPSYLDDNFEGLRNYIITHFSEKLTLKSLAAEFNMNPNYCCSLFTKYLGQTFSAYLTELRITEAQNLLHNSDYSLEEIASLVGFKDYFYFSKVFKKYCKYSPKEYRTLPH